MEKKESQEDYLEKLLMLQLSGNRAIHAVDLAKFMGFSKPSVSIALRKLEEQGLIQIDDKAILSLTSEGLALAKKTYERHKVIGSFFESLGIPKDTAYGDACRIEHDLSDETFAAFKSYIISHK